MARRLAFALLILGALLWYTAPAEANHLVYLPYVPSTPLMQQVIKTQEYTWCADARATNYPGFIAQLQDEETQYAARTGIKARQVAFSDPGCMVKHTMPESFSCGPGAAACIYYLNWPVTVEYKYTLGYVDWRTAQGHELGHGLLGLHEQYNDSGGNIGCTGRQETVMDCGSGVRYPQALDVSRGCAVIKTSWCGTDATQVCVGNPCWNGKVWKFSSGWSVDPVADVWYDPKNRAYWGPRQFWGGRCNLLDGICHQPGEAFYDEELGNPWLVVP